VDTYFSFICLEKLDEKPVFLGIYKSIFPGLVVGRIILF